MSSRNRKYDSGAEKRKKRKRLEAVAQSQKGALDKFFLRETPNANIEDDISDDMAEVDANIAESDDAVEENVDGDIGHDLADEGRDLASEGNEENIADDADDNVSFRPDMFDPRTWDGLDPKMIDILLQKGPKRDLSIEHGPRDNLSRRFLASSIHHTLKFSQMERSVTGNGLFTAKSLTKYFVFVANY